MPLTTVYIRDDAGREYGTNVEADTIEEAVQKAVAFFDDPFWCGPKPKPGTVFRVSPIGGTDQTVKFP